MDWNKEEYPCLTAKFMQLNSAYDSFNNCLHTIISNILNDKTHTEQEKKDKSTSIYKKAMEKCKEITQTVKTQEIMREWKRDNIIIPDVEETRKELLYAFYRHRVALYNTVADVYISLEGKSEEEKTKVINDIMLNEDKEYRKIMEELEGMEVPRLDIMGNILKSNTVQ